MRQVWMNSKGEVDVMEVREVGIPDPRPGQVRIKVGAAGVNFADVMMRRGLYPDAPNLPAVAGYEVAGTVDDIGPDVAGDILGAKVVAMCNFGGYSESICLPRDQVWVLPAGVPVTAAAALPVNYLTAWQMVVERAKVQPGDSVLVHAGASGVGNAALQIAKMIGARVMTTVGSPPKAKQLQDRGFDDAILYKESDFANEVRRRTGKRGVDVIIDHVGIDTWEPNIRCLTKGGRLVLCGATSGYMAPTNLRFLFFKNLSLLGSTMGSKAALLRILSLVETKQLTPWIHDVLPMNRVQDAHEILESRQVTGKVVLSIN